MKKIPSGMAAVDWPAVTTALGHKGFVLLKKMISAAACKALITDYDQPDLYRKVIAMERYRFGQGEYKYFGYPLPDLVQSIREDVYPWLAPVANQWMEALQMERRFPETFQGLLKLCHEQGQTKPTPLILRYGPGGYNTLHQDLYGDVFFPMQAVLFLNDPEEDFTGGEFVIVQQIPRAQSKAIVLKPQRGDMLIFTTNFRPVKGARGYYRVHMKHGVSEVHEGERHTLGIIFHDALN